MANLRSNGPYVWVTWLPRLLSGESSCEWASWFKAQHEGDSWTRVASGFDLTKWLTDHTALLNQSREAWERRGYSVLTEEQNRFNLRGQSAVLGRQAGPDSLQRRRGRRHRHENGPIQYSPSRTGDALHVCSAQGTGAVPRPQAHRTGGLLRPRGGHSS